MMKKQLLCCCITSVLFLGGCSKKEEPQTVQDEYDVSGSGESETETETVATSPVILSKTAVQPLPLIDGDILGNFPEDDYRYASPARFPLNIVERRDVNRTGFVGDIFI
ncbi:hypothetical protein [Acinetobacter lactucae]|uniref:hypothetical protein n=1 Tax=Acinetobacter lactucae TaxID=1785128 RepID=UPI00124F1E8D|nr:hypothetical protein [Acinetobacter lactucae]